MEPLLEVSVPIVLMKKTISPFLLIYPQSQGGGARIKYYPGMRAGLEVIHRF